jgi:hypothetical protein
VSTRDQGVFCIEAATPDDASRMTTVCHHDRACRTCPVYRALAGAARAALHDRGTRLLASSDCSESPSFMLAPTRAWRPLGRILMAVIEPGDRTKLEPACLNRYQRPRMNVREALRAAVSASAIAARQPTILHLEIWVVTSQFSR